MFTIDFQSQKINLRGYKKPLIVHIPVTKKTAIAKEKTSYATMKERTKQLHITAITDTSAFVYPHINTD